MLNQELHFLLMKCFHNTNRLITQKIPELGLLPGQPKVLECLLEQDGQSPRDIGRRCSIDKSTMTSLLNKMEQQQLIVRQAHPQDRRSVTVRLTQAGREKARAVRDICAGADALAWGDISPALRDGVIQGLNVVLANLEAVNHE